jgi:hypothetical protein
LSVRRLLSTCGSLPGVSVVGSSTRSSSIAGEASTPLWPVSSFWGVGRYHVHAVSLLPHFRVQPYLWSYPLLSCFKWAPSPPLPPMMPWLPVCFPLALAVCTDTPFSDDLVRCSCDKLSAAPCMILVLCILPPPHAKGYVWLMTCLPHVLHCKPDSDRHLTMFPAECPVFHHIYPSPFSRSYLPLQGVSWPPSLSHS